VEAAVPASAGLVCASSGKCGVNGVRQPVLRCVLAVKKGAIAAFSVILSVKGIMKTYAKFAVLAAVIIGTLVWLGAGGINDTSTYYKTISEIGQLGPTAQQKRLRVIGDVEKGSIIRSGAEVRFVLVENQKRLPIVYRGTEPLPDTFRDGAQALADGRMGADGTFEARQIQAKCASKYESKYNDLKPAANKARI
jgi:cytochrome c-type biogenesis protein CcmE